MLRIQSYKSRLDLTGKEQINMARKVHWNSRMQFYQYRNVIIEIRRSYDRHITTMGFSGSFGKTS